MKEKYPHIQEYVPLKMNCVLFGPDTIKPQVKGQKCNDYQNLSMAFPFKSPLYKCIFAMTGSMLPPGRMPYILWGCEFTNLL